MTRALAATTLVLLALCGTAGAQSGGHLEPGFLRSIEDAQLHGTVTPPGADTRHATTEIAAYDGLVQAYPKLTDQQLRTRFFKQRLFGPIGDPERTYRPRAGVTVIRDAKWGEPHIFGETDEDMAFGAGYVTAEDRLALMELLRTLGRAEAFELIGTAPAWLADAEVARLYGYTEEEFQAQIDRLPRVYGPPGRDIVRIIDAYVAGVNEYIAQAQKGEVPLPGGFAELGLKGPAFWKPTDVVAAVSTVRALFGAGGGSELRNATLLAELIEDYGPQQGRAFYDDFRSRQNARRSPAHHPPLPVHGARRREARPRFHRLRELRRQLARQIAAGRRAWTAGRGGSDQDRAAEAVHPAGRRRPVAARRDVQPPRGGRQPLGQRPPDPDRRSAGRLLLAADPPGLRAALADDPRPRGGLPGPVADRGPGPHAELRLDAHRGRQRHDRHLRRAALRAGWRQRRRGLGPLPLQGAVPADGPARAPRGGHAAGRRSAPRDRGGAHGPRARARAGHAGRRTGGDHQQAVELHEGAGRGGLDPEDEPQPGQDRRGLRGHFPRVPQPLDQLELRQRRGDRLRARRSLSAPSGERRPGPARLGHGRVGVADRRPGQRPLPRTRGGAARGGPATGLLRVVEQPAWRPAGAAPTRSGAGARSIAPTCSRTQSWPRSPARSIRSGWFR